jgi:hypothetical protein
MRQCLSLIVAIIISSCAITIRSQSRNEFLGIKLRPEVRAIVSEIELRTRKPIQADFTDLDEFTLGSSYIDEDSGAAVILVDPGLQDEPNKLEAVVTHELLHMRLRVNNYPTFIFSPSIQTSKGRALDVEQEHVNDLLSIIEHRIFKADMERFGVYKYIDLAGDTAADAKGRNGGEASQADSINYARAILEYPNRADVATVERLFRANGWTRPLTEGKTIAEIIDTSDPRTAKAVELVFLRCLSVLFPPPRPTVRFTLTIDPSNRYFRRMVINLSQSARTKRRVGV